MLGALSAFMRLVRPAILVFLIATAFALRAQSLTPTVVLQIPAQQLSPGGAAVTIDVRNYITVPGLAGSQFVQFDTVLGRFNVELRADVAPQHVTNFLAYVQRGTYTNSFFHRAASFDNVNVSIVQGGGYGYRTPPFSVFPVEKLPAVPLEYNLANSRGTLAAARTTDVNSATSEWFFNVQDNSATLGPANGGGYSVFGRVMGTGMSVVDAIAALPRFNAGGPYTELPLRNYTSGDPSENNLVIVNAIRPVTLYPTGGGPSVIEFTVENSAPNVVTHLISGTTLTLTPASPGTASITVRGVDANNNAAVATFSVSVAQTAPEFTSQPMSQVAAAGSTVVFNAPAPGAARHEWRRNSVVVPGATSSTLVLNNVSAADAGTYVAYAENSIGQRVSQSATLEVVTADATSAGRLVNLSILTVAGAGPRILTMGAVIGPFDSSATMPLVIRGVGPTLAQAPFNVAGVLPDPVMTFFAQGNSTPIDSNDNWGGSAALSETFNAVGAFALPANSLDSAIVRAAPGVAPGGYTVQVTGKGDESGTVIAEIYDATSGPRTANTPRLINLSTLAEIDAGSDLAVGFVLTGQTARTVLVRGVGPSLSRFNVSGAMEDPRLELFNNNTQQRILVNDDWSGNLEISSTANSVGAFPLVGGSSKDASMLVTLPPGAYSARISGVNNTGGTAIVEVYEVR